MYTDSLEVSYEDYLKKTDEFNAKPQSLLITYSGKADFINYANYFGIMEDFKVRFLFLRIYLLECL